MAYPYPYPTGSAPYPGGCPAGYPAAVGYPAVPAGYPVARSYYYIRCRLNGLVLDIEGGSQSPGARVITWSQKPGACDNQLWYDDFQTGTIRSKMNDFCLEFNGSHMIVQPYYYGNMNQQWERADPFIRMRTQPNRVLDIANNNSSQGAHLVAWDRNGGNNQCFDCQFLTPAAPAPQPPRQRFFIVSDMHGKVLDIEGGSSASGAKLIVWPKKYDGTAQNQLWYFDCQGIIRSVLNDFALSAKHNNERVHMTPFGNHTHQQWRLVGNRIMKNSHECLDISGGNQGDGAQVIAYGYKGSANQHWHIEYA